MALLALAVKAINVIAIIVASVFIWLHRVVRAHLLHFVDSGQE
jgi:hypothetical protein